MSTEPGQEPSDNNTPTGQEPAAEPSTGQDTGVNNHQDNPGSQQEPQGGNEPQPEPEPKTEPEPSSETPPGAVDVKFNGVDAQVDIPEDVTKQLSEAGLNAEEVVKELYDGEFGLADATKEKLYGIYGKSMVDSYLNAVEAKNELTQRDMKAAQEAQEAADAKIWEATLEQVGGEENWNALEKWAESKFTDEQFDEFNAIMDGGSAYAQRLAIDDLMKQYRDAEGDMSLNLVSGDNAAPAGDSDYLTAEQYKQLFIPKKRGEKAEYYSNPEKYDAMRKKGAAKGL